MRRRFIKIISSELSQFDITNYITIEALEDNLTISVNFATTSRVYYGIDGIGWNEYENEILLNRGQTISFKGTNVKAKFYINKPCNILGNGYSLLVGDNAVNLTDISVFGNQILSFSDCPIINVVSSFLPATTLDEYCYSSMFQGCTSLTTAPELPATTLADYCYYYMFSGCTSLTAAPELPATTLADSCYYDMFNNCTSLTTAPELPATVLAKGCYIGMFSGCTSLTTAPDLPTITLSARCYINMFRGCSKLNYIKMLATDISAFQCLAGWVDSVSSTGTFVKNPAMTSLPSGDDGIPSGWVVLSDN